MRVLLADSRSRVRFALRALLEEQCTLSVVGEASTGRDLLAQVEAACPDVILLGWELPGLVESDLPSVLRRSCPNTYVIALGGDREAERAALGAGAEAFVSKMAAPEHLLAAIAVAEQTMRGRTMTEITKQRGDKLMYAAVIALAVVALVAVAGCLAVSLVLIDQIPFHHIFPH